MRNCSCVFSQRPDPARRRRKSASTGPTSPCRPVPASTAEPPETALTPAPATGLRPVAAQQQGSVFSRHDGGPISTGLDTPRSDPAAEARG